MVQKTKELFQNQHNQKYNARSDKIIVVEVQKSLNSTRIKKHKCSKKSAFATLCAGINILPQLSRNPITCFAICCLPSYRPICLPIFLHIPCLFSFSAPILGGAEK